MGLCHNHFIAAGVRDAGPVETELLVQAAPTRGPQRRRAGDWRHRDTSANRDKRKAQGAPCGCSGAVAGGTGLFRPRHQVAINSTYARGSRYARGSSIRHKYTAQSCPSHSSDERGGKHEFFRSVARITQKSNYNASTFSWLYQAWGEECASDRVPQSWRCCW